MKVFVRSGVAAARSRSAGRSSLTVGSAARVNGRSSSRMIGVVVRRNGRTLRWVGPSARAVGRSASSVGPSSSASRSALPSVVCVICSEDGSSRSVSRRAASWLAKLAKTALESATKSATTSSLSPSSSVISEKLWIARLMFAERSARASLTRRESFAVGSIRRIVLPSARPLPPSAWPPSLSSSVR